MKKLLLILKNNEVSYARVITQKHVDNAISTFPYRRNDDSGNPYARALRTRDHNLNRGANVDVIILDNGDPEDYYFKRYNPVTKEFSLGGLTEAERKKKIDNIEIFFGIEHQFDIDSIHINKGRLATLVTEAQREMFELKIKKHEPLSEADLAIVNSLLINAEKKDKELITYIVAAHYSRICIDPIPGVAPVDKLPEERKQWRDTAISWWKKLEGTDRDREAQIEIARIYAWTGMESETKKIYEGFLDRPDFTNREKKSIERRIALLGGGREIYDRALELYKQGKYKKCLEKLDEYDASSSGIVKEFLAFYSGELRGKCLIEKAKLMPAGSEKNYTVEKAKRLIYPERK